MMEIDFAGDMHSSTPRDCHARATPDKWRNCEVARRFGPEYWSDPEGRFGYRDYRYDGRHRRMARRMIDHYGLRPGMRVLDVGCGPGSLLRDMLEEMPGMEVVGCDISGCAARMAREQTGLDLVLADTGGGLPFPDASFDLVLCVNVLHNLGARRLATAIAEVERLWRRGAWVCVESYRDEREKQNMLDWALTCESYHRPDDWKWLLRRHGYAGDIGFIFFEGDACTGP